MENRIFKVGIIDDELSSIEYLQLLIERIPFYETCMTSTRPLEGMAKVKESQPDILILDVRMAEFDGVSIAAELSDPRIPVIFISGYKLDAELSYEVDAVDFVSKPVSIGRLTKALKKAKDWKLMKTLDLNKAEMASASMPNQEVNPDGNVIYLRALKRQGFHKYRAIDIDYIKGSGDTPLVMVGGQKYYADKPMVQLEKELRPFHIIRVHKSYMVNLSNAYAISQDDIVFTPDDPAPIPIGRTYKEDVMNYLKDKFIK